MNSLQQHLQQFSSYDQDTGLMNYDAMLADINSEIAKAGPLPLGATLIEIRIRGLSRIGEVYGRKAIGSVIRQLAERLALAPIKNRILGRIDHKSFGVFLSDVSDPVLALQTAKQLVALCSRPVPWSDHMLNVEAIAGVALTTDTDQDAATLLHHAGLALRASSESGSPGYSFFDPAEARAAKRRNDLVAIVAKAVEQNQFEMVYQPFFAFNSGKLVGFEALMRLKHPEFGISAQTSSSLSPRKSASSQSWAPGALRMPAARRLNGLRTSLSPSIFRRPNSIPEPCWPRSTPPLCTPSFQPTGSISKLPKAHS